MSVDNFIPEIWSAQILEHLSSALIWAQPGVVNRDYEGEIANHGDTVHITQFGDPSITTYDPDSPLNYESLSDDDRALDIDQAKSFSFKVDDIERRQALPGFVEKVTQRAAYRLAAVADAFVAGEMAGAEDVNSISAATVSDAGDAYELLVEFRKTLVESSVPPGGWWVGVDPGFYAALLKDTRFVNAEKAGSDQALRNGYVGRAAGFDVYETNNTPNAGGGAHTLIAGSPVATTYAEQINKVEALRLIDSFGDGIRGLHLYGAKVVQPKALVICDVTTSAS